MGGKSTAGVAFPIPPISNDGGLVNAALSAMVNRPLMSGRDTGRGGPTGTEAAISSQLSTDIQNSAAFLQHMAQTIAEHSE